MRYNRFYHPAYLWGRWIAFIGIIFIAIAYFARDFIPMAMQPALVGIVVVLVIGGGIIGIVGGFMSFDRGAYPTLVAILLFAMVMFVILLLATQ